VYFDVGPERVEGEVISLNPTSMFVRSSRAPDTATPVTLVFRDGFDMELLGSVRAMHGPAPDGRYSVIFDLLRVTSADGRIEVREFVRHRLGYSSAPTARNTGQQWWIALVPEGEPEAVGPPPERVGPVAVAAGHRADDTPPPSLQTGYSATTVAALRQFFDERAESKVGAYLNVPCAYIVAGTRYWGRALRFNDRWLNINTNSVVPGLGVRLRCDLTLEIDGIKRVCSIKGIMNRKLTPPAGSAYTGALGVRINDIDEGESPGLLLYFLDQCAARTTDDTEAPLP